MRSCLLAIRLFRPSKTISEQRMSDLLKLWCDKVLDEFGISGKDLYSSTSDSGSDVKRLCYTLLTSRWDWCISHMSNCALVEAFGTWLQAHKCKNPEFRAILKKVKSVIEHLHKSPKMRSKFEDMQFEETGKRLKLVTDMPHRWLGTIRVLERFLMLWKTLRRHYYQKEESAFPVDDDYQVLVECFSLAKPVGDLITLAQATDYPAAIDAFMGLCRLRKSVLADSAPLPIYDPTSENYSKGTPVSFRHTVALHDITVKTRRMLAQAFQKRFFEGYNGTTRSNTLEMQAFLHPAYRSLRCLDHIMGPSSASSRRQEVQAEVIEMAYDIAEAHIRRTGISAEEEGELESPAKIALIDSSSSTAAATNSEAQGLLAFSEFEDPADYTEIYETQTLFQRVEEEVTKYVKEERVPASEITTRKLLNWWKTMSTRYPNLSTVAQSVLSHPASSAAIERDFGYAGNVLTGSRSRVDAAFVDMSLFLNTNFSLIPGRIEKLDATNQSWMNHVPTRFTGEEYVPFEGTEEREAVYQSDNESDNECDFFE